MIREIDFAGIYLPPLAGYLVAAAVLWYALRFVLTAAGFYRFVWHPPLFNSAVYVVVLSTLVAITL